jgi:hypothetical protein
MSINILEAAKECKLPCKDFYAGISGMLCLLLMAVEYDEGNAPRYRTSGHNNTFSQVYLLNESYGRTFEVPKYTKC